MAKQKPDRKKLMIRLIAIILAALMMSGVVFSTIFSFASAAEIPMGETQLTVTVDETLGGAYLRQQTDYFNSTGKRLGQALFAINLNALRRAETAPVEAEHFLDAYPGGFTPGGVELFEVKVNGEAANWGVQGEGETFVRVDCDIAPGESAQFTFEYELLLPEADGFAGTGALGWRLAFFYFQPVHYDQRMERFSPVELTQIGSAMYFDAQKVTVTVDAPDTYLIASGGTQTQREGQTGRTVTTLDYAAARDVALALSRRYSMQERAGQVALKVYSNASGAGQRALDAAEKAVEYFSRMLGDCPVKVIDIAQVEQMEDVVSHSGAIWISEEAFSQGEALERAVAYGVAKMWFGQSVMVDPEREAWLTDAVCAYMACLYDEAAYGENRFLEALNRVALDALNVTIPGLLQPDSYRSQFSRESDYQAVVVGRGTAVLHEVRKALGDAAFTDALAAFYQENRGGVASVEQFVSALSAEAGHEMGYFLMDTLSTISEYVNHNLSWYE